MVFVLDIWVVAIVFVVVQCCCRSLKGALSCSVVFGIVVLVFVGSWFETWVLYLSLLVTPVFTFWCLFLAVLFGLGGEFACV